MIPFLSAAKSSLRYWMRRPWLALAAIAILAFGSAAVNSIWIVADTLIRQALPLPESHQLYSLQSVDQKIGKTLENVSIADLRDFQEQAQSFTAIAGYRGDILNYADSNGQTSQLIGARVTAEFKEVFRIQPLMGRLFEEKDFETAQSQVALLGYDCWQTHFNGDPRIIGKSIRLNKQPHQVIGVLPKKYREPGFSDIWLPFPKMSPEYFTRDARYWSAVARLKPDVTPDAAKLELKTIAQRLDQRYPATNRNRSASMLPFAEALLGDFKKPLIILFLAVSLLMFATCLNLANIQLTSGLQRQNEIGSRLAFGESRRSLIARTILESFAICAIGCLIGTAIAGWFIQNIDTFLPPYFLPRIEELKHSGIDLKMAVSISLLASLALSLLPALQAARCSPSAAMGSSQSKSSLSRRSLAIRWALLSAQFGLTTLIILSAMTLKSEYDRLAKMQFGFNKDNLLLAAVTPGIETAIRMPDLGEYYHQLVERVSHHPSVLEASSSSAPPLWGFDLETTVEIRGRDLVAERDMPATALYNSVGREYFEVMDIRILSGRTFEAWDTPATAPVAIVNQAFVDTFFADEDPIGQEIRALSWMERRYRRIVGVVDNVTQTSLSAKPTPQIYVLARQTPWLFTSLLIRHKEGAQAPSDQIKRLIEESEPDLGINIVPMEELLESQLARTRIMTTLLSAFAGAVSILTLFGTASQVSFNIAERKPEWGTRMALGAGVVQLRWAVVKSSLGPIALGSFAGLLVFGLCSRFLLSGTALASKSHLFLGGSIAISLCLSCLLVSWLLASRIGRMQPTIALKSI